MTGSQRRMNDNLHDVGCQTLYLMDSSAQLFSDFSKKLCISLCRDRVTPGKHSTDYRVALLGACHRLDHISGIRWVQVTEKTDGAPIIGVTQQHAGCLGLGIAFDNIHRLTLFIVRSKITSIQLEVLRILTSQNSIRLSTCCDQYCPDRVRHIPHLMPVTFLIQRLNSETDGLYMLPLININS